MKKFNTHQQQKVKFNECISKVFAADYFEEIFCELY